MANYRQFLDKFIFLDVCIPLLGKIIPLFHKHKLIFFFFFFPSFYHDKTYFLRFTLQLSDNIYLPLRYLTV